MAWAVSLCSPTHALREASRGTRPCGASIPSLYIPPPFTPLTPNYRQGDPGDSFYLSHLGDRMLEMYLGSTLSSAVTRLGDESLLYEQQPTGRMLVGGVQQRYDHDVRMREWGGGG